MQNKITYLKFVFLFLITCLSLHGEEGQSVQDNSPLDNEIKQPIPVQKDNTAAITTQAQRDLNITHAIKESMTQSQSLTNFSTTVNVSTVNGVVTLTGTINSDIAKAEVGQKAKNMTGVVQVINNIEVTTFMKK